jgi:hypothetical protein
MYHTVEYEEQTNFPAYVGMTLIKNDFGHLFPCPGMNRRLSGKEKSLLKVGMHPYSSVLFGQLSPLWG